MCSRQESQSHASETQTNIIRRVKEPGFGFLDFSVVFVFSSWICCPRLLLCLSFRFLYA